MAKRRDILMTILFCAFLGMMVMLLAVLPKQRFSVNEKRQLAKFPQFTAERFLNGKWETEFEDYISDHFPARDLFVASDSYYTLYSGRNGAKGVYKGREGNLFNTPVKCDNDKLTANLNAVVQFAEKTGIKTYIMAVPSAGYIMTDKLPKPHMTYDDEAIRYEIEQICAGAAEQINIFDIFKQKKNDDRLYYKTDHHWTSEGAYTAYCLWADRHGIPVREKQDYTVRSVDGFYGTLYTKSALWGEDCDTLEMWQYPIDVTVHVYEGVNERIYDSMFFEEHLENADKYPVFMDGNHGFERIVNNDNPNGPRVLVIKDSFAHCFVPFMAENCSVIDMVDLRYYYDSVSKLAEKNNYDETLILYGISNLCEANDLSILQ